MQAFIERTRPIYARALVASDTDADAGKPRAPKSQPSLFDGDFHFSAEHESRGNDIHPRHAMGPALDRESMHRERMALLVARSRPGAPAQREPMALAAIRDLVDPLDRGL